MALISAMALCSFLGLHANTITIVAPTLAFAIGIDGALFLYNSWVKNHKSGTVKDHLMEVFASTLPSLTIVSSTAIGLLAGGLFPIEEYAGLSVYLGVTVLFVYAYQICFLSTVIVWCSPIETHRPLSQEASRPTKPRQIWFDKPLGMAVELPAVEISFLSLLLCCAFRFPTFCWASSGEDSGA
ncbi:hypothetical protein COOONC_12717 [Cooperia oncophora]